MHRLSPVREVRSPLTGRPLLDSEDSGWITTCLRLRTRVHPRIGTVRLAPLTEEPAPTGFRRSMHSTNYEPRHRDGSIHGIVRIFFQSRGSLGSRVLPDPVRSRAYLSTRPESMSRAVSTSPSFTLGSAASSQ